MRVIGYVEGTPYKVTVFKMDNKFTLKFETPQYEQGYKLKESDTISNFEDVKSFAINILEDVQERFQSMHFSKIKAMSSLAPADEDEFETII